MRKTVVWHLLQKSSALHTNLAFELLVVRCFSNLDEMSGNGIGADWRMLTWVVVEQHQAGVSVLNSSGLSAWSSSSTSVLSNDQWSNCGGTRENSVPLPFLAGERRSPSSHDRCPLYHQLKSKYGQFFCSKPQVLLHSSDTTIALSAYCCWRYLLNTVIGSKHCHVVPNKRPSFKHWSIFKIVSSADSENWNKSIIKILSTVKTCHHTTLKNIELQNWSLSVT